MISKKDTKDVHLIKKILELAIKVNKKLLIQFEHKKH